MNLDYPILTLPGWQNSEVDHWQSLFEEKFDAMRVAQSNWMQPSLRDWVEQLNQDIQKCKKPPVIIAHSLGCTAFMHWAAQYDTSIACVMLVSPPDINRKDMPQEIISFRPEAKTKFSGPGVLVATDSDPYISLDRAKELARQWGLKFIQSTSKGHINVDAGHGPWLEGEEILASILKDL